MSADTAHKTQQEVFEEIEKRLNIPVRTSRMCREEKLYPEPELRGRTGFYNVKESQIFEIAEIIKILKNKEWNLSLREIKDVLRPNKNDDFGVMLERFKAVDKMWPLTVKVKGSDKDSQEVATRKSLRNQLMRKLFLDALRRKQVKGDFLVKLEEKVGSMPQEDFALMLYEHGILG